MRDPIAWAIVGFAVASFAAEPLCGQCAYEVTAIVQAPPCGFLGPPPSTPWAINEAGVIAGSYHQCFESDDEAFTWSASGGFVTLPRPSDSLGAAAYDLNDSGWVVGFVETATGQRGEAALWQGGEVTLLGIPPGGNFSLASGVNDSGVIVGWWGNYATGDPARAAFRWVGGIMTTLELPMGPNAVAFDVNEAGAIVGWMGQAPQIDAHAFIYEDGNVTDLGVIPGGYTAVPKAISEANEVVGSGLLPWGDPPEDVPHPFLYADSQMVDLGTLPEFPECWAHDVNDGRVVGSCGSVPFLWRNGVMHNVNDLLLSEPQYPVTYARAINGAGQIAANEWGTSDTMMLTPLPPPIADINGDCQTDVEDLMILIDAFGQSGSPADLNGDGVVNVLDLIILLLNFRS